MLPIGRAVLCPPHYKDFMMANDTNTLEKLPKQLLILMGTVIEGNTVQNWNIYENARKQTCITIRFGDHVDIDPVHYRRVSVRQAERNIDRAARHNLYKHTKPTSIPDTCQTKDSLPETTNQQDDSLLPNNSQDIHTNKKRKYSCTSPEIVRGNMLSTSDLGECIHTPESLIVHHDHSLASPVLISTPPPTMTLTAFECLPESTIDIKYEHVETLLPPISFPMNPTVVDPVEYMHAVTLDRPISAICTEPVATVTLTTRPSADVVSENKSLPSTVIKCPCCDIPMDASHTCDNPEDTDNTLSEPEPPDPPSDEARTVRFNDHMNSLFNRPESQEKLKKWMDDGCKTQ